MEVGYPFGDFVYVLHLSDKEHLKEWVEKLREGGQWRETVTVAILRNIGMRSVIDYCWILLCSQLVCLDLSGNEIESIDSRGWNLMSELRILQLHDNSLKDSNSVVQLSDYLPNIQLITLWVDLHAISDSERYSPHISMQHHITTNCQPISSIYEPMNCFLRFRVSRITINLTSDHIKEREVKVLSQVAATVAHIRSIASNFNPSVTIQSLWRGYRIRKSYAMIIWKERMQKQIIEIEKEEEEFVPTQEESTEINHEDLKNRGVELIQRRWKVVMAKRKVAQLMCVVNEVSDVFVPPNQVISIMRLMERFVSIHENQIFEVGPSHFHIIRRHVSSICGWEEQRERVKPFINKSQAVFLTAQPLAIEVNKRQNRWNSNQQYLYQVVPLDQVSQLIATVTKRLMKYKQLKSIRLTLLSVPTRHMEWFLWSIRKYNSSTSAKLTPYLAGDLERITSAVIIQKSWRAFRVRRVWSSQLGMQPLRQFCSNTIQRVWRGILARKRAAFLGHLKQLITDELSTPPSRAGTEVFLSISSLTQFREALRLQEPPADVPLASYDINPISGVPNRLVGKEQLILSSCSRMVAAPRDGEFIGFAPEGTCQLPAWLVSCGRLRSAIRCDSEDRVSLFDIIFHGVQIAYASVPSRRSFSTIIPSPQLDFLHYHKYGFLCMRYGTRCEAVRRKILFAALTYDSNTETFLCFEPPEVITTNDAAEAIQFWWFRMRKRAHALESIRPSSSAMRTEAECGTVGYSSHTAADLFPFEGTASTPLKSANDEDDALEGEGPKVVLDVVREKPTLRIIRVVPPPQIKRMKDFRTVTETVSLTDGKSELELVGLQPSVTLDPSMSSSLEKQLRLADKETLKERVRESREIKLKENQDLFLRRKNDLFRTRAWDTPVQVPINQKIITGEVCRTFIESEPVDVKMTQLKLSAALQRFADQANCVNDADSGLQKPDIAITAADMKWMTSKELTTLSAAKLAKEAIQLQSDVAIRKHAAIESRLRYQKTSHETRSTRASNYSNYRYECNFQLSKQWQDNNEAKNAVRERTRDNKVRLERVISSRELAVGFVRQQNVLKKERLVQSLQSRHGKHDTETIRRTHQRRLDAVATKERLRKWKESELLVKVAVTAYGAARQREALNSRKAVEALSRRSQYTKRKKELQHDSKHFLERFEATASQHNETGNYMKPMEHSIGDIDEEDISSEVRQNLVQKGRIADSRIAEVVIPTYTEERTFEIHEQVEEAAAPLPMQPTPPPSLLVPTLKIPLFAADLPEDIPIPPSVGRPNTSRHPRGSWLNNTRVKYHTARRPVTAAVIGRKANGRISPVRKISPPSRVRSAAQ